jgi:putative SOS response-associated peptidase YedK
VCGRYVSTSPPALLAEQLGAEEVRVPEPLPPRWNVAPTDPVYAVAEHKGRRQLGAFRWGLVPFWARDTSVGSRLINARAESVVTKPAFRRAFERRRCLLPADGFYEWQRLPGGRRQPWFVHRADGAPMAFAGLWEVWRDPADPDAEPLRSCTIVTTEANELLAPVHDRMPVVLSPGDWDRWLDPDRHDVEELRALLVPADPRQFELYQVSTRVNKVTEDGPDLVAPVEP